jgi:hypothetical protein
LKNIEGEGCPPQPFLLAGATANRRLMHKCDISGYGLKGKYNNSKIE